MKRTREANPPGGRYVPTEVVESVIEATPDIEIRLVLALARYAGVRVPSEVRRLSLGDFNIDAGTIRIESPKFQGRHGFGTRLVLMRDPIKPHARAVVNAAQLGQVVALATLTGIPSVAIAARIRKAIAAAGVSPWPQTLPSLRASWKRDLAR